MTTISIGEKRFLNYQGANFTRSLYYLISAAVTFLACNLIKFKPSIPPPGAVAGPPIPQMLLAFASFIFTLFAILDALFVLYQNFLRTKQFAFDEKDFFIIRRENTEQIPLQNITQIALASVRIQNGVRGYYTDYRISYTSDGEEKNFVVRIYSRMDKNFQDLRDLVKVKNPTVEIINWATSLDWIFRLFKKKKRQDTGDLFK